MKKSLLFAALASFAFSASAASVTNTTTGVSYDSFAEAFEAAGDSNVITINEDITIDSRLAITKPIIIKGANSNVAITRNFKGIMMLVNAETTFENITLTSVADEMDFTYLEVNKIHAYFNNVTFKGIHTTKNQGIVAMKTGGKFHSNNVTFTDCTSTSEECPGFLFYGINGAVYLNGNNDNVSITIEAARSVINAGADLAVSNPITFNYKALPDEGATIVNGTRNAALFNLVGAEPFVLAPAEDESVNALVLSMPGSEAKAITNKTTGVGYSSLDDAFQAIAAAATAAQEAGDTLDVQELVINRDITINSRLTVPYDVVITGANPGVKIKRGFKGIMLLVNAPTTFSNIILASNDEEQNNVFLEVNKVKLTLDGVEIMDAKSLHNQGLIALKQGGKLYASDLSFTNCSVNNEASTGFIFYGKNANVELNNHINGASINIEPNNVTIHAGTDLDVDTPIEISFREPNLWVDGTTLVAGVNDPALFNVVGLDNLILVAGDGEEPSLVLKDADGIADITGEAVAAPAIYYDLTGRRVLAPAKGGIYIVRQGTKTSKVAL